MARLLWLPTVLKSAGLKVVEEPGWKERGADTMKPLGIVLHHTAGPSTGTFPSKNILINGRPDLTGPLCQVGYDRARTFHVIASGKANHAGAGSWQGMTGNSSVIGLEMENVGTAGEPWSDEQLADMTTFCAAIMLHLGRDVKYVCGHKEWAPTRKVDPHTIDMNTLRKWVGWRMEQLTPPPEMKVTASLPNLRQGHKGPHVAHLNWLLKHKANQNHVIQGETFTKSTYEGIVNVQKYLKLNQPLTETNKGKATKEVWRALLEIP